MKTALFFSFVCLTLGAIAQDNPYCPCQEEARREQELTLTLNEFKSQILIYMPQEPTPQAIPVSMPHPPVEEMRRVNVKPKLEEAPELEDELEEEVIEEALLEEEIEIEEEEAFEDLNSGLQRTKLKTKKRLFAKRIKPKKRKKKYRGGCPRF